MDYATKYAQERVQFDKKIASFQAIQWMIADAYTELEAARLLLMQAAYRGEQGQSFMKEAAMAKLYATEAAKWKAITEFIRQVHSRGRPILVGTRSVRASEHLSDLLTQVGLEHEVLNAVRHAEEARPARPRQPCA
jgi:preprotein translocase subunit SecA